MTQTRIKPIRLNTNNVGSPGKIPAYVSPDEMERVEQAGGGIGIIPGFNEPEDLDTYLAGEDILTNQYTAKYPLHLYLDDYTDNILTGGGTINFGQAIDRKVTGNVTTIKCRIGGNFVPHSDMHYSLTLKVYAISGTYGVDAKSTGSALYTSDTITGSFGLSYLTYGIVTFTFNTSIPNDIYMFMIEGNMDNSSGVISGKNAPVVYAGNCYNAITDTVLTDTNMYFLIDTNTEAVYLSNASNHLNAPAGLATEDKVAGENIKVKKYGEGDIIGATNNGARRYLSDTPGELSLTPGTNVRIIGQGSGVNKVWMGRTMYDEMNSINKNDVYYTNTGGMCGGWFNSGIGSFVEMNINIQVSVDNVTREVLQSNEYNQSVGGKSIGIQAYIPAGYYFKIVPGLSNAVIDSEYYYFNPIK